MSAQYRVVRVPSGRTTGPIACATLTSIDSTYRWQGSIEHSTEVQVAMHTTGARAEVVVQRLKQLHPYEVPCILVVPVLTEGADDLAWVDRETQPSSASRLT